MSSILDEDVLIRIKRVVTGRHGDDASAFVNKALKSCAKEAERKTGLQRAFDAGAREYRSALHAGPHLVM